MKIVFITVGILLTLAARGFCQVEGTVRDPDERALTGTLVIAIDSASKKADSVKTDNRGFYFFTRLKPGVYQLQVVAAGSKPISKRVIVGIAPAGADAYDDTYYALRRDFILTKSKEQ